MNFEHEHIERIARGLQPHITKYLSRALRKRGTFLVPDAAARAGLSDTDIFLLLKEHGIGGQVFVAGARIAGYLLRKKTKAKDGLEWVMISLHIEESFFADKEGVFMKTLGHFGKMFLEEAWANNAHLARFADHTEKHQMLLIEAAVAGTLPIQLRVGPHGDGDPSRLILLKANL